MICADHEERSDGSVRRHPQQRQFGDGLAIGVGAGVVLPLAAPTLRPLAKTAIKGGILAYRGAAGMFEGLGDLVAQAVAEGGEEVAEEALELAVEAVV